MSWTCRRTRRYARGSVGSSAARSSRRLVVALVLVLTFSPILAIKSITVSGNSLVSEKNVQQALVPLHGVPLSRVGHRPGHGAAGGQPAVKDAIVQAEAPNTLQVQIIEFVPVAVLLEGKKRSLGGSRGPGPGIAGAPRTSQSSPPIASSTVTKDPKVFSMLTRVLSELPDKLLANSGSRNGHQQGLRRAQARGRTLVIWGNDQDSALKTKVLEALLGAPKDKECTDQGVRHFQPAAPGGPVTVRQRPKYKKNQRLCGDTRPWSLHVRTTKHSVLIAVA